MDAWAGLFSSDKSNQEAMMRKMQENNYQNVSSYNSSYNPSTDYTRGGGGSSAPVYDMSTSTNNNYNVSTPYQSTNTYNAPAYVAPTYTPPVMPDYSGMFNVGSAGVTPNQTSTPAPQQPQAPAPTPPPQNNYWDSRTGQWGSAPFDNSAAAGLGTVNTSGGSGGFGLGVSGSMAGQAGQMSGQGYSGQAGNSNYVYMR